MDAIFLIVYGTIILASTATVVAAFIVPCFISLKKERNKLTAKPKVLEYIHFLLLVPIGYIILFATQDTKDIDLIAQDQLISITIIHALCIAMYFLSKFFKQHWGPLFRAILPCFLCIGFMLSIVEFIHFSGVTVFGLLFPFLIPLLLPWFSLLSVSIYCIQELLAVLKYNHNNLEIEFFRSKWSQALYLIYYGKYGWLFQILTLPFYIFFVQIILVLSNQKMNALLTAFIDTKNGVFSEHYRFFLDNPSSYGGATEYVCTVASYGNPKLVKPFAIGNRSDGKILVNRQLQICNAFEEWLYLKLPKIHKPLRKFYDSLQIPVEKWRKIKNVSNVMYVLIKPLEWFCLLCLYLFQNQPEDNIGKQYL